MAFLKAGTPYPAKTYPSGFNKNPSTFERRVAEEWAPSSRNMTFEALLKEAIKNANGKLGKPETFPSTTDACYFWKRGLPAFGFSPMANTQILLHDHNEFLNKDEYLKGINVYKSIIKVCASFDGRKRDEAFRAEL